MTRILSLGNTYPAQHLNKSVVGHMAVASGIIGAMANKDPWNIAIGQRLRAAVVETEIFTAERLTELLGLPPDSASTVRNWLNGTSRPKVSEAKRLKKLLGVTLDWIYEGDDTGQLQSKNIRLQAALAGEAIPLLGSALGATAGASQAQPGKAARRRPRVQKAAPGGRSRVKAAAT